MALALSHQTHMEKAKVDLRKEKGIKSWALKEHTSAFTIFLLKTEIWI
jgi:hypothetical protein